jgi:type III secretory pathway lipoprotein EscJ
MIKRVNHLTLIRLRIVLLLALIIVGGISCATQKVQTVTEETEANEILDVLLTHGIRSTKIESGDGESRVFEIHINGGDEEFRAAIQLMEDHCLPQPKPPVIEGGGIVSSMEVEKSQELRRIKIDAETLLRNIPGATCVDVNLVEPDSNALSTNPYPASATVLIKFKTPKLGTKRDEVAKMVAGSVPGLSPDNVFVTLTYSPLRPLPDFNQALGLRRALWVVGIGLVTILLFVSLAWYLRKRALKRRGPEESETGNLD